MESKINYLRENYKSTKNYIVTYEKMCSRT